MGISTGVRPYDDGERFHGLRKLSLANGITDPAQAREVLAFAIFRAAGVPAPRTAFANVTLTVPGKFDKEYVGLYTLVEHVVNPFLREHFKSAAGLLLKPEGMRTLEYLGEVEKRTASVAAQLAGASKGYVPTMNFGPGGPNGGPGKQVVQALGGPFLVFNDKVQNELKLDEEQKQKLQEKFPDCVQETMKVFEKIKEAKPEEREKVMQEHRQKFREREGQLAAALWRRPKAG